MVSYGWLNKSQHLAMVLCVSPFVAERLNLALPTMTRPLTRAQPESLRNGTLQFKPHTTFTCAQQLLKLLLSQHCQQCLSPHKRSTLKSSPLSIRTTAHRDTIERPLISVIPFSATRQFGAPRVLGHTAAPNGDAPAEQYGISAHCILPFSSLLNCPEPQSVTLLQIILLRRRAASSASWSLA